MALHIARESRERVSDPCVRTRLNTSPPVGRRQTAACGTEREKEGEREKQVGQRGKESRTRQVARASVRLCATMAACARRLDRRLLGPMEGRRREAKDDVAPGWRDPYRGEGGVDTGTSHEQKQHHHHHHHHHRRRWETGGDSGRGNDNRLSYLRAAAASPRVSPFLL